MNKPNAKTTVPRLALKGFKTVRWMSEETICFTATLLLDGKPVAVASNEGHGGSTFLHYSNKDAEAVVDTIAASLEPEEYGWGFLNQYGKKLSAADVIDILVEIEDKKKGLEKLLKKMRKAGVECLAYLTKDGKSGEYRAYRKGAVTDLNRQKYLDSIKAKPDFLRLVSDMSDAEILAYFVA